MSINLDPTVERSWKDVRMYWRQVRGDCARCGGVIHYDEPRYWYRWNGQRTVRKENLMALDVGHKVERDRTEERKDGKRIPYPTGMIAPIDTQPEHVRCNRKAGGKYVHKKNGINKIRARFSIITSREW